MTAAPLGPYCSTCGKKNGHNVKCPDREWVGSIYELRLSELLMDGPRCGLTAPQSPVNCMLSAKHLGRHRGAILVYWGGNDGL